MTTDEPFEAALKRHISQAGYLLDRVRDQVRVSVGLGISVPFLNRLVQGEADVTEELGAKLAEFFKTDGSYWSDLQKQRNRPHVIEGVPYEHKLPEEVTEVGKWPHAEFAAKLAREYYPSFTLIEIEPNVFMGGVTVKTDDLIRVFDVYYIERLKDNGFTLWAGKRVTYQRPYKNSGKWSLQRVEPLERTREERLPWKVHEEALKAWAYHEWDRRAEDFSYGEKRIVQQLTKTKALLSPDELSLATTVELEALLRACSRILTARRQDNTVYEYEQTVDTGGSAEKPELLVVENDGNGNVVQRSVKFKDRGRVVHGKVRQRIEHSWEATFLAKNGSVEAGDCVSPSILLNGNRISLYELLDTYDEEPIRPRVERYVGGIKGEFLEEADKRLLECEKYRRYEAGERGSYFKDKRLALEAYVEWATGGARTFDLEQVFQYGIDHYYGDDGKLPDVFLVTVANGSVVFKNIPFPPRPTATRRRRNVEMRYASGRAWVPAKNGDGIKFCDGTYVRHYFPFNGELFEFREPAITEARFLRYVDGLLPDVEKCRENKITSLGREAYDERSTTKINAEIEQLDQFIAWLNER